MHIVAFLDILGSKENSDICDWNTLGTLDFANPVAVQASQFPQIDFSVFSDSIIISAPQENIIDFFEVLSFLDMSWKSDNIFVRGGITLGEFNCVKHDTDRLFSGLKNFSGSRVYGKALAEAHSLESKSGPGSVCFVSPRLSALLISTIPNSIYSGPIDIAVLHKKECIERIIKIHNHYLNSEDIQGNSNALRQHKASLFYYNQLLDIANH